MRRNGHGPLFGMMNHPARDLVGEIREAKRLGFDFVDLTLEPPMTGPDRFRLAEARRAIAETGLGVVGHTGWHLPGHAAYPEVRRGVTASLLWALGKFHAVGARTMTYHVHGAVARYVGLRAAIEAQAEVLAPVAAAARRAGMRVLLEHVNGRPEQFEILDGLFRRVPSLGFHLDVGHANLTDGRGHAAAALLRRYGRRLGHVHLSDNRGGNDDHLPLGVGTVPWPKVAALLRRRRWRGTITLEVFCADVDYVAVSLRKARAWFR